MIQKVLSFVREYHMLERNDHVVAGISGGADSVCLLLLLKELQQQMGFTMEAVHIEHGIRGEESRSDQQFVETLCREQGIECHCFAYDVPALSREWKMTEEEAGRRVRYETFERCVTGREQAKIAVAHNQNDCAETMLFHLARGTGLKGLEGIPPVRGRVIRPLLCVSRAEIESFLGKIGQNFCTDRTNFELEYTRNKIRHKILPVLREVNEKAVEHMYQASRLMAQAQEYMEQEAVRAAGRAEKIPGGFAMERAFLKQQPEILQTMILHELLSSCAASRKDLTAEHIGALADLLDKQVGKRIDLPYGLVAENGYEKLLIYRPEKKELDNESKLPINITEVPIPGKILLTEQGAELHFRLMERKDKNQEIPLKAYTKWLDYDKIRGNLQVRTRRMGDYFVMNRAGDRQTLKKYLINEKVPAQRRDQMILVADGECIVWAVGYRISESYKITEETKRILEIQFILEEQEHE